MYGWTANEIYFSVPAELFALLDTLYSRAVWWTFDSVPAKLFALIPSTAKLFGKISASVPAELFALLDIRTAELFEKILPVYQPSCLHC